jgi:hypothetical protein
MENGWVKLHRKILENPISKRPQYLSLWIHLLVMANHKKNKMMWNGEILSINEGQFITGRKELSEKTGIPETTIEDILKFLERQQQIRQQKTTKFRLITVINWEKYQVSDTKSDNKPTTERQQADTNKNDKKDKNEKNVIPSDLKVAGVEKVLESFYKINPTLNWGNKNTRKAASDLIQKFGLDGTLAMAEQVISVQGKPYAPVATTPYQMKEKLAQFKVYFDSEKNKSQKAKPSFTKIS